MRRSQGIQVALAILIIAVFTVSSVPVSAQRTNPGLSGFPSNPVRAVEVDVVVVMCKETNTEVSQFIVDRRYTSFDINGQVGQVTDEVGCAGAVAMYFNMGWRLHDVFSFLVAEKLHSEYLFLVPRVENGGR